MPQRPHIPIVSTKGLDLVDNMRKAWAERHFQPHFSLIAVRSVADRVYETPLVNYANGPARQLMLPQGIIKRDQSIDEAVWSSISDAFLIERPRKSAQPYLYCVGYYDHTMNGRVPPEFKKGKRFYYITMDIDEMKFVSKDPQLQQDENPVTLMTFLTGLGAIRSALATIAHEGKKWASIGMIEEALMQRFDRDTNQNAKRKFA